MENFNFILLIEAKEFFYSLSHSDQDKIAYNINSAKKSLDTRLFKKLSKTIWELRIFSGGKQIRFLCFWDKSDNTQSLVLATHGFIKKVSKVPVKEIDRADNFRKKYFEQKK